MLLILKIGEIFVSVILIFLIIIQAKAGGLSASFGGSSLLYGSKRGVEKIIFYSTIFFAVAFAFITFANFLIK